VSTSRKRVLLAAPRGYCAGVDRAVRTVEEALRQWGAPIYVRHEIVHNRHVVESLRRRGAIFTDDISDVPQGARVIFSAHGVAPAVREQAADRSLRAIDATCPLVTKVHHEAIRFAEAGYDILLIGHAGHEEVIGTMGEAPGRIHLVDGPEDAATIQVHDPEKVVWLSQTTLSVDETTTTVAALKKRFPALTSPPSDDICYATQNRQNAIKQIAPLCDLLLAVGSSNSSNSARLVEVALAHGARHAHLIDTADQLQEQWLHEAQTVGVTSGASVPEILVSDLLHALADHGYTHVDEHAVTVEQQVFALPRALPADAPASGRGTARGDVDARPPGRTT